MMKYALLAILCLLPFKSLSQVTNGIISKNSTRNFLDAPIALAETITGEQDSLSQKISADVIPEITSVAENVFTEGDTSKTMGKLYKINTFMEWYIKFFPVPIASYSEETDLLIGLSKYNAFTLDRGDTLDTITQPSSISALAYYTLNTQHKFVLETNLMLNKNKALWKTDIVHTFYPLQYYGVGNDTELEDIRTLNSSDFQFSSHYLFKTWKNWYIGPAYDFYYYYDVELDEESLYQDGDSIDLENNIGRQSGLGINISMEGRDNRLNAKAGFFVDATFQVYDEAIGSEYNFNIFNLDLRYYVTPLKNLTIATQVRTQAKTGYIPVQSLSLLGGDYNMRGSYLGRYRDKNLIDSQLELRFPIFWIFGGTVFGGVGQVAPSYNKMALDSFHYTYGLGARLKVDSVHDINLRFDIGMSNDQHIFIMNFAEAF